MLYNRIPDLIRHQLRHDAALLPLEDEVLAEERDEAAHKVPPHRPPERTALDEVGGRGHDAVGVGDLPLGEHLVEEDGHGGERHPRPGAVVQLGHEAVLTDTLAASLPELEEEAVRAGEGECLPVGDELALLRLEDGVLQAVDDELRQLGELRRGIDVTDRILLELPFIVAEIPLSCLV